MECRLTGNSALETGGGLLCRSPGTVAVTGCLFSGNHAIRGGGLGADDGVEVVVARCDFLGNDGSFGGGVSVEGAQGTFAACRFSLSRLD